MEQKNHPDFYDSGCIRLIEAIVRKAAEDHLAALRRPGRRSAARLRETAAFFRSDYFSRLTGLQGDSLLRKIVKEAKQK